MEMLDLPDEMLAHMLQWMPTTAVSHLMLCCKRLREVIRATRYSLDFETFTGYSVQRQVSIASQFWCIQSLVLQNLHHDLTDSMLEALSRSCPQISQLRIVSQGAVCRSVTDAGIVCIAVHFPLLTTLAFSHLPQVDVRGLKSLGDNCKSLSSVNISACDGLTSEALLALTGGSAGRTALTCLTLGALSLSEHELAPVLTQCCALQTLTLASMPAGLDVMRALASLTTLTSLTLEWCSAFKQPSVAALQKSKSLAHFAVRFCRAAHGMADLIKEFGRRLLSLEVVSIPDGPAFMAAIAAHALNLSSLTIFSNFDIDDKMVAAVVQACPKLASLSLSGTSAYQPRSHYVQMRRLYHPHV